MAYDYTYLYKGKIRVRWNCIYPLMRGKAEVMSVITYLGLYVIVKGGGLFHFCDIS